MRALRRLLVTLVVLAALALAVDRGGAYGASQAADSQARRSGIGSVNVRILGFPFLTQVAAGSLSTVTVSDPSITTDGVTITALHATGHGVHLSLSAVLAGRVKQVPIDHVEGSALLTYAHFADAVTTAIGIRTGLALSISPSAEPGDVVAHLTGPLGLRVSQTLPVPTVSGGRLQLGAFLQRVASFVPGAVAGALSVPLPALPYGLRLGAASATSDGIRFEVTGSDVTIPTSGATSG